MVWHYFWCNTMFFFTDILQEMCIKQDINVHIIGIHNSASTTTTIDMNVNWWVLYPWCTSLVWHNVKICKLIRSKITTLFKISLSWFDLLYLPVDPRWFSQATGAKFGYLLPVRLWQVQQAQNKYQSGGDENHQPVS